MKKLFKITFTKKHNELTEKEALSLAHDLLCIAEDIIAKKINDYKLNDKIRKEIKKGCSLLFNCICAIEVNLKPNKKGLK